MKVSGSYEPFDGVLVAEGFLDRPFRAALGSKVSVRLVEVSGLTSASKVDGSNGAYDLDGDGRNDIVGAGYVVEIVIWGVSDEEAKAVNERLDGPGLGAGADGDDLRGRVIYRHAAPGSACEVHIYITHH